MRSICLALTTLCLLAGSPAHAQTSKPNQSDSILELPKHAIERSQLTLPGSAAFHLKATIIDPKNPANADYRASIELYWVSAQKWRRVVTAPHFSQTLIANGDRVREELDGDYDPNWLRTLVNAIVDPGAPLQGIDLSTSDDNPHRGGKQFCRRFATAVGIAPVTNDVYASFCFEQGLIASVGKPGYNAYYSDPQPFLDKLVARKILEYLHHNNQVEAHIDELTELKDPPDSLFAIQEANTPLQTIVVSEEAARGQTTNAPAMQWPTIEEGAPIGVLSVYVSIDRNGRVRETHDLNTDHPDMSDAAGRQLLEWRFKPFVKDGLPVQAETILTFAYKTRIQKRGR
ncbi:MAG TPA: energy transducer TonB [Thermoanaerobaculia bacterium]|nr:energy transducer TonB [Thermoanaerobaculia bacterium]